MGWSGDTPIRTRDSRLTISPFCHGLLADQRSTAADVFVAMALAERADTETLPVLLEQTAGQLQGALLAMWAASGEAVPDEPPEEIQSLYATLRGGDLRGYASLKSEINRLRLLSQTNIDQLGTDIGAIELRIESLRARESSLYLAYVFLNLLGLIAWSQGGCPGRCWNSAAARVTFYATCSTSVVSPRPRR